MVSYSSVNLLSEHLRALMDKSSNQPMIVLVGGCSRTGKTVLVSKLIGNAVSSGINAVSMQLDSWLISLEKRIGESSVLERYEVPPIISSIKRLQQTGQIYPPVYDAVSRRRIAESRVDPIYINEGILFVEVLLHSRLRRLFKMLHCGYLLRPRMSCVGKDLLSFIRI